MKNMIVKVKSFVLKNEKRNKQAIMETISIIFYLIALLCFLFLTIGFIVLFYTTDSVHHLFNTSNCIYRVGYFGFIVLSIGIMIDIVKH